VSRISVCRAAGELCGRSPCAWAAAPSAISRESPHARSLSPRRDYTEPPADALSWSRLPPPSRTVIGSSMLP
jgi:hypothetical protein